MSGTFYLLFFICFCLIQFFFGQYLSIKNVFPNFILIAIVFLALSRGQLSALVMGFFFGLVWDVFSTDVVGSRTIMFMAIGYFIGMFSKSFDKDQISTQIVVVFLANVFYWIGFSFIVLIFPEGYGGPAPFVLTLATILKIVLTTLISPVVFFVLNIARDMFLPHHSFDKDFA